MIRRLFLFQLSIVALLLCRDTVRGQGAGPPQYKIEHGYVLPNAQQGVMPIRVRVTRQPPTPSSRDQTFYATVSDSWDLSSRDARNRTGNFTIPAGKTSAETVLYANLDDDFRRLVVGEGYGSLGRSNNSLMYADLSNARRLVTAGTHLTRSWLIVSKKILPIGLSNSRVITPTAKNINSWNNRSGTPQSIPGLSAETKTIQGLSKFFNITLSELSLNPLAYAITPNQLPENWIDEIFGTIPTSESES